MGGMTAILPQLDSWEQKERSQENEGNLDLDDQGDYKVQVKSKLAFIEAILI